MDRASFCSLCPQTGQGQILYASSSWNGEEPIFFVLFLFVVEITEPVAVCLQFTQGCKGIWQSIFTSVRKVKADRKILGHSGWLSWQITPTLLPSSYNNKFDFIHLMVDKFPCDHFLQKGIFSLFSSQIFISTAKFSLFPHSQLCCCLAVCNILH